MRGSALKEELSDGEIRTITRRLNARLRPTKKTLDDVICSLGGVDSPYFMLCIVLNSLVYALFDHLHKRDQFLRYGDEEFEFPDEHGDVFKPEHPSTIDSQGRLRTANGAIPVEVLTKLANLSAVIGCGLAFYFANWPLRRTVILLSVLIMVAFLFSQAFFFSFLDRFSLVAVGALSKAISVLALQSSFEAAPGRLRVFAVGLSYCLGHLVVFVTLVLFKKDTQNYAETHFMFLVAAVTAFYALVCPDQLVRSIVRKDPQRLGTILKTYSPEQYGFEEAIVDDVLFKGSVPWNTRDALRRLLTIKPFRKKLFVLTILITFQSRMNSGEVEFIKMQMPFSPLEAIFFSRIAALFSALLTVFFVLKMDRRSLLVLLLAMNLLISLAQTLVPIDSFSRCFEDERPGEKWTMQLVAVFLCVTMLRVATGIVLHLMALEHIPTLYRSYFFPLICLSDATYAFFSDAFPLSQNYLYDTPVFVRPTIRYSIVSVFLAAMFIDPSDFVAMSTDDVRCYHTKRRKHHRKVGKTKKELEEQFRLMCEAKSNECRIYGNRETDALMKRQKYARDFLIQKKKEKKKAEYKKENDAKRRKIMSCAEARWQSREEHTKKLLRELQTYRSELVE